MATFFGKVKSLVDLNQAVLWRMCFISQLVIDRSINLMNFVIGPFLMILLLNTFMFASRCHWVLQKLSLARDKSKSSFGRKIGSQQRIIAITTNLHVGLSYVFLQ